MSEPVKSATSNFVGERKMDSGMATWRPGVTQTTKQLQTKCKRPPKERGQKRRLMLGKMDLRGLKNDQLRRICRLHLDGVGEEKAAVATLKTDLKQEKEECCDDDDGTERSLQSETTKKKHSNVATMCRVLVGVDLRTDCKSVEQRRFLFPNKPMIGNLIQSSIMTQVTAENEDMIQNAY